MERTHKNSGPTWLKSFIMVLWTGLYDAWTERNKDRHGRDDADKQHKQLEACNRRIRTLYDRRDKGLLEERHQGSKAFYSCSHEHLIKEPGREQQEVWLAIWEPAFKKKTKQRTSLVQNG